MTWVAAAAPLTGLALVLILITPGTETLHLEPGTEIWNLEQNHWNTKNTNVSPGTVTFHVEQKNLKWNISKITAISEHI